MRINIGEIEKRNERWVRFTDRVMGKITGASTMTTQIFNAYHYTRNRLRFTRQIWRRENGESS